MMFLTFLSNKRSPAPLLYMLLHIALVAGLVLVCPSMIDFSQYPLLALFWGTGAITIILYFVTHLRDPGFIPHDAIYLAERETPSSDNVKTRHRVDSLIKLKSQHSSKPSLAFDNNTYSMTPEAKDRISEINKNYFKKLYGNEPVGNSITTNNIMLTNLATEGVPHCEKKNDEDFIGEMKDENYEDDLNQSIGEKEKDEDVVACEMTMDQADESMQVDNIINFNADSGGDIEAMDGGYSPKKTASIQLQSQKELGEDKSPASAKSKKKIIQSRLDEAIEQRDTHDTEPKTKYNEENQQQQDLLKDIELTSLAGAQHSKRRKYMPFKDETEPSTKMSLPISLAIPKYVSEPESIKSSERRFISTNDEEAHIGTLHTRHCSIKSQENLLSHRKLDESPKKDDFEKQKEDNEQEVLYVERRYCTVCGFEQPLRAKHCRDCDRCVAQYDHHCPWLGTCIGQKNHSVFYWFLIFQCIQLAWGEYEVFVYMITGKYENWGSENVWRVTLALFLTFFLIMVVSLICFHSYLACVNLTTWESLSWYKISYLRDWHEDWGSPFDEGCVKNLKFFCCRGGGNIKIWEMPKYKKPLDEQEQEA